MEDKKSQIMETALALFAEKGYHNTSIQEIADRIGIAKGSVYSFFRSKEELLITIFDHYHQLMYEMLRHTLTENLPPREKLEKLIGISLEQFRRFKLFLTMQRKESHLHQKREIRDMVFEFRAKRFFAFRQVAAEVYGKETEPYWIDLATIISGMTFEFMNYAAFDRKNVDFGKVNHFIINVLDASAEALVKKKAEPVLTLSMMNDYIRAGKIGLSDDQQHLLQRVWELKDAVLQCPCSVKQREEAEQAYSTLESEVLRGNAGGVNARAMALFLGSLPDESIQRAAKQVLATLQSPRWSEGEGNPCVRGC